jgi:ABC-type Mn2+/Zn2+ transport system permease subunit
VSLGLGLLVGVLGHYLIYRLSLPSKPFIYVAF